MTDIVEMLRHGLEEHEMLAMGHRLFDDAADEIERLREEVRRLRRTPSGSDSTGCAGGSTCLT